MSEIKNVPTETHEGKQRGLLVGLLYGLVVIGLTFYIVAEDLLFAPFYMDLMTGDDNKYPVKATFMLNLLTVGVILFPLYWIAKKMVAKKNQDEIASMPIDTGSTIFERKEFTFSYGPGVNTVMLDNMEIHVKMGFVKRNFMAARLRNFYLLKKNQYLQLYITYEDESGKIKKCPLNSESGDQQIQQLNAELEKRFPTKSLNNLSQKEAFKALGAMNPTTIVVIILLVIVLVVAGIAAFAVMDF